ncbi:MAG: hypoxanthine phosphoribosyltransferase [Alloprevotella sp.]|nr:hypoxanthine phosphoribosyltransferase [Alloprevotella sp.]
MTRVNVKDKVFKPFISEVDIKARVKEVAQQIKQDLAGEKPLFLTVLNGAFIFAADLVREVDIDCEISFIRLASYAGTSSTGVVRELIGLNENLEGRTVVIIEDIIDSGLTMQDLISKLTERHPAKIKIAALLVKPDNLKVDLNIDYACFRIPNDFILGYGLDYDGEGRNLKDIYVID